MVGGAHAHSGYCHGVEGLTIPLEHSLQRRPEVMFAKRGATWRKRVSILRKWGRNAPAPTSPTPFGLLLNHIKLRKYNTYVAFRKGAGAGPTPFPDGNEVGPEPTHSAKLSHSSNRERRQVGLGYEMWVKCGSPTHVGYTHILPTFSVGKCPNTGRDDLSSPPLPQRHTAATSVRATPSN